MSAAFAYRGLLLAEDYATKSATGLNLRSPDFASLNRLTDVLGIPPDAAIYPIPGVGVVIGTMSNEFAIRSAH